MKYCPKCKANKTMCDFGRSKQNADGLDGWCKQCRKMYRIENPKPPRPYVRKRPLKTVPREVAEEALKALAHAKDCLLHLGAWDDGSFCEPINKATARIREYLKP